MDIQYRTVTQAVEMAKIEYELWNHRMEDTFPLRQKLVDQQLIEGARNVPTFMVVAEVLDTICGYICYRVHGVLNPQGWIHSIVMKRDYEGLGIGSQLLSYVERHLRELGVKQLAAGGDPGHLLPGVPVLPMNEKCVGWFKTHGFKSTRLVYDMFADLADEAVMSKVSQCILRPIERSLTIRPAAFADRSELIRFVNEQFSGRWSETLELYLESNDIGDIIIIHDDQSQGVLGFAQTYSGQSKWIGPSVYWIKGQETSFGGMGPMGVHSSLRGKGLGLLLLAKAVVHVRNKGIQYMTIDWTDLESFYGKCGFVRSWQYLLSSKDIS